MTLPEPSSISPFVRDALALIHQGFEVAVYEQAKEIRELMPRIRDFSELGEKFFEPLRTYSSGISIRLAFSLATAVRPDVLIIDEALSVGDQSFQQKSFDRIRELRGAGTSLLFVSHDGALIGKICDRALVLDGGSLRFDGPPADALAEYGRLARRPVTLTE